MFESTKNSYGFEALNDEEKDMLSRINAYSEKVLGDIDPQKTLVSVQLEKLKPIMQEIADEKGMSLTDVFIKYMDMASIVSSRKDAKLKSELDDAGLVNFTEF